MMNTTRHSSDGTRRVAFWNMLKCLVPTFSKPHWNFENKSKPTNFLNGNNTWACIKRWQFLNEIS